MPAEEARFMANRNSRSGKNSSFARIPDQSDLRGLQGLQDLPGRKAKEVNAANRARTAREEDAVRQDLLERRDRLELLDQRGRRDLQVQLDQ